MDRKADAWMNIHGFTISARGYEAFGKLDEVNGYTIPLYRDLPVLGEPIGTPPYQTLPWVADFLNRRNKVCDEMKEYAKKNPPTAFAGGPHVTPKKLLEWARRLEVPSDIGGAHHGQRHKE